MPHHADHQEDLIFHYSDTAFQVVTTEHGLRIESLGTSALCLINAPIGYGSFIFTIRANTISMGKCSRWKFIWFMKMRDGHLLVVALLVSLGEKNSILANIQHWVQQEERPRAMTNRKNPTNRLELNVLDFLPHSTNHFSYHGSLTTPPCTQGVQWILLRTPIHLSQTQLNWFSSRIGTNARPIQPVNERQVEEY